MFKGLKRKIYLGIGLMILLFFGMLFLVFQRNVDWVEALWAVVGILLVYILYVLVDHWKSPKMQVDIATSVELIAPPRLLKRVKNYRLKVSTTKHIEEKGKERTLIMDELLMTFNDQDHPDTYAYCLEVIGKHMETCLAAARESHPDAKVVASPLELPPSLKQLGA